MNKNLAVAGGAAALVAVFFAGQLTSKDSPKVVETPATTTTTSAPAPVEVPTTTTTTVAAPVVVPTTAPKPAPKPVAPKPAPTTTTTTVHINYYPCPDGKGGHTPVPYDMSKPNEAPPCPVTTTTTTVPKTWVKVATLSGTSSNNSVGTQFELKGGQQRMTYQCSMPSTSYTGSTTFHLLGGDVGDHYGEAADCETERGAFSQSGSRLIYAGAGVYHLEANATPNNTWSVVLEELR